MNTCWANSDPRSLLLELEARGALKIKIEYYWRCILFFIFLAPLLASLCCISNGMQLPLTIVNGAADFGSRPYFCYLSASAALPVGAFVSKQNHRNPFIEV